MTDTFDEKYVQYLKSRLAQEEERNRFTAEALEMAASLGDFQSSINKLRSPEVILAETAARIRFLIRCDEQLFLIVDEATNDFMPAYCSPEEGLSFLQKEADRLIEEGIFAWVIRERRPVILPASQGEKRLLLHVMATSSRIRGMYVSTCRGEAANISDTMRSLLSIILLNSSNALESFELYKTIREISESLERKENYRLLFEAAPDGVEVLDAKGTVIDCNRTQELMLGRRREGIIGSPASDFLVLKEGDPFSCMASLAPSADYMEGEVGMRRHDGTVIPVWRKGKAVYNDLRELVGWVIYNRDLSPLKKTEEEKRNLEARLRRAKNMEAIGTLAGGVAHDLNNILGGLINYPELLNMHLPEGSPLRRYVKTIQRSGEKAAAIVQDLLALVRREVVLEGVVNINQVVIDYLASPEHERLCAAYPGVQFECILDEELKNAAGSPVHLSKILMNLVANAAESIVGAGRVTIGTANRSLKEPLRGYEEIKEGDYVVLTVTDSGTGITDEDLERIFEPFYTKKVMGRSGTGLGLAVVWGTVKDHQGYIDVQSTVGVGSSFNLYFPASTKPLTLNEEEVEVGRWRGKGERILVIDDVAEQREIAAAILEGLGYKVAAVSSGEEAVSYLKGNEADLILLDMILAPGMDGLDTYRTILEIRPNQKAVIVSGYSETERVREAQRLGAGAYLKKPYLLGTLGKAVKEALTGRGH